MAEKHPLKVLADYRATAEKTQADLAQDLGVAPMTVSRWETGDRKIGVKTLPVVAEMTGIPREQLRPDFFGDNAPATAPQSDPAPAEKEPAS